MEKINTFINTEITKGLQQLDELVLEIAQFIRLDIAERIWPIVKQQRLLLLTDDPHLATHLRFQQHSLQQYLSQHLNYRLNAVHIKLISLPLARPKPKITTFYVTDNTANSLLSSAQGIEDKELRESFKRLIRTANRPQILD
jgi:hypothetical protein